MDDEIMRDEEETTEEDELGDAGMHVEGDDAGDDEEDEESADTI